MIETVNSKYAPIHGGIFAVIGKSCFIFTQNRLYLDAV